MTAGQSTKPSVFLSYAREDGIAAVRLCADLRERNRRVWFDQDSIRGGERWRSAIDRAIREADFFVALLSDVSVSKRGTVQAEVKKALDVLDEIPDNRTFFIPARLTVCEPSHPVIRELQWIDLFPTWTDGVDKLVLATELEPTGLDESGPPIPFKDLPDTGTPPAETDVRVFDLVRQATDAIGGYASARGILVRVRDEAPGARVRVRAALVSHALINVLHNALKYSYTSPDRGMFVDVTVRNDGLQVRVDVTNLGVGVDPSEQERIFDFGYRGQAALQMGSGLGIGLWLVRQLLEKTQGTISIESRPMRGGGSARSTPFLTCVTLWLRRVAEGSDSRG